MIIKLASISHTYNALSYCERGGECIYTHNCFGSTEQIYDQMKFLNAQNERCSKPTFHIKMRMAPEDYGKLSLQEELNILNRYAEKIGYNKNSYAVFIHKEGTPEQHFHVVASRIQENKRAVSDSFYKYKNNDFCREIEEEFGLRRVERYLDKVERNPKSLKETIFDCLDQAMDFDDFRFELQSRGIKMKSGRGISFIDKDGIAYKGSELDRRLSLGNIKKYFGMDSGLSM